MVLERARSTVDEEPYESPAALKDIYDQALADRFDRRKDGVVEGEGAER